MFVDGKYVGPSPQIVRMPVGMHAADRITAGAFRQRTFDAKLGETEHVYMPTARDGFFRKPGNVLLSKSANFGTQGSWHDGPVDYQFPGRMQLAPGHYATWLFNDKRACDQLVFDVPKLGPKEVFYVYVDASDRDPKANCMPIAVRTQKVVVP